jgi:hypothetical protein
MHQRSPHLDARLGYQQQDSAQTLAQGLEEYYGANVDIIARPRDLPPESLALFRSHDLCHVIFGLGTSLEDEAMADVRTLFSCDVGLRRYATYLAQDQQVQSLFKEVGYLKSAWATVLAVPRIARAALAAWHMKRRWPWIPPESFRNRTLADLRREFGINVL